MLKHSGFWLKTAALFLVRSGRSTAALSLMVVTAVATLIFLSALAVGINDAMIRNSAGLYAGHITGFDLPAELQTESLAVDGVAGVVKRVPAAGILAGPKHFETVLMLGIDPAAEEKNTAFWKKTVQGSFLSGASQGVFISRTLAEALAVNTGDMVKFSPGDMEHFKPLKVQGVYETGIEQLDRGISLPGEGKISGQISVAADPFRAF